MGCVEEGETFPCPAPEVERRHQTLGEGNPVGDEVERHADRLEGPHHECKRVLGEVTEVSWQRKVEESRCGDNDEQESAVGIWTAKTSVIAMSESQRVNGSRAFFSQANGTYVEETWNDPSPGAYCVSNAVTLNERAIVKESVSSSWEVATLTYRRDYAFQRHGFAGEVSGPSCRERVVGPCLACRRLFEVQLEWEGEACRDPRSPLAGQSLSFDNPRPVSSFLQPTSCAAPPCSSYPLPVVFLAPLAPQFASTSFLLVSPGRKSLLLGSRSLFLAHVPYVRVQLSLLQQWHGYPMVSTGEGS